MNTIAWPALLRLHGEAELQVIHDQHEWDHTSHWHTSHYVPADVLIDSTGMLYDLQTRRLGRVIPAPTGAKATLEEILTAVQAHAAQMSACCAAKVAVSSIAQAIASVDAPRCPP